MSNQRIENFLIEELVRCVGPERKIHLGGGGMTVGDLNRLEEHLHNRGYNVEAVVDFDAPGRRVPAHIHTKRKYKPK